VCYCSWGMVFTVLARNVLQGAWYFPYRAKSVHPFWISTQRWRCWGREIGTAFDVNTTTTTTERSALTASSVNTSRSCRLRRLLAFSVFTASFLPPYSTRNTVRTPPCPTRVQLPRNISCNERKRIHRDQPSPHRQMQLLIADNAGYDVCNMRFALSELSELQLCYV